VGLPLLVHEGELHPDVRSGCSGLEDASGEAARALEECPRLVPLKLLEREELGEPPLLREDEAVDPRGKGLEAEEPLRIGDRVEEPAERGVDGGDEHALQGLIALIHHQSLGQTPRFQHQLHVLPPRGHALEHRCSSRAVRPEGEGARGQPLEVEGAIRR
jgi:hypothetical protein